MSVAAAEVVDVEVKVVVVVVLLRASRTVVEVAVVLPDVMVEGVIAGLVTTLFTSVKARRHSNTQEVKL